MRIEGPDLTAFGDGEPLAPLPLTCRVRPAALEVLVPRR
jgi:diacylglycerol kinase (ATP)